MGKGKSSKPKGNGRPAADKKPPGCYVLSLKVRNVRCFGDKVQELGCSDGNGRPRQWTVILGDNGTGKTTLLQSLANFASSRHYSFRDQEHFKADPSRMSARLNSYFSRDVDSSEAVCNVTLATGASLVDAVPATSDSPMMWIVGRNPADSPSLGTMTQISLVHFGHLFVAYGASRSTSPMMNPPDHVDDGLNSIYGETGLRDSQRWLTTLDYSALKAGEVDRAQQVRLEQVIEVLQRVLPDVKQVKFSAGSGPYPQPSVKFLTPYGWVPLRQLGHGYQTMIAWVVDFVSRMVERYPESENPLAEPAVCLVDEIDLHLHPVWQRKVIGYLSDKFPNTQFIVTAHSPLVVQAAASADANIAVLVRSEEKDADGNHYVEIRNNPEDVRNWRLDQILTSDLFGGIDLRSVETEKLFTRKRELLAKPRRTKAEDADLVRVQAEIDALPVGDSEKFARELDLLRRAADELKSSRKP